MLSFTIGLRALRTAQQAMDVIGQNVANASTPGYSRRLSQFGASEPLLGAGFGLGTGVRLTDIRRIHDGLLEMRLREQHQVLGRLDAAGALLQQIEYSFQEPGDSGLSARLDELWSGFSELTQAPGDPSFRDSLVQSAQTLAAGFRQTAAQIGSVGEQARQSVVSVVDEVNGLARDVAALNDRILSAGTYGNGGPPADLVDEQDRLLQQMSDWIDPQVIRREDGTVDVLVAGRLLVSGDRSQTLEVVQPGDGTVKIHFSGSFDELDVGGGRLRGLLDLARDFVPRRLADLDRIARQLALEVNRLHTTGVSALGPFTSLSAAVAIGERNGGIDPTNQPLADLDLPFPIHAGQLVVNVIESASGSVSQHTVSIDPQKMSLTQFAAALDALPNLTASLDSVGRLRIAAEGGFGFDFSSRLDVDPDDGGSFGSGTATLTTGKGPFALSAGDTLTLDVNGTGNQTVTFQASDFADITEATAEEIAAVINGQVSGVTALVEDGRVVLRSNTAGSGGSLTVTASTNTNLFAAGVSDTGSDLEVGPRLSGQATDGTTGHFTVRALGDGTVGLTAGLEVEVIDANGVSYGTYDIGAGYTPGDPIEVLPGVSLTLAPGTVSASAGDVFEFDVVGDSDTADVLVGLEIGTFFTGHGAADFAVADAVAADSRRIAGSRSGEASDPSNFFAFLALKDAPLADLGGRTLAQEYGDLVASAGLDVRSNQTAASAQAQLLASFEARREEVSGVNQDEEMLKLVEYEQLYQAASRYLQAVSQLHEILFNTL